MLDCPRDDHWKQRFPKNIRIETSDSKDGPWATVQKCVSTIPAAHKEYTCGITTKTPCKAQYYRTFFEDNHQGDQSYVPCHARTCVRWGPWVGR